ncbi:hypothetical protein ES703_67060 [subsurface metagenome]
MKSNLKTKRIMLIILGILFVFIPILTNNPRFTTSEFKHDNLKVSAISGKIYIDGNSGWAAFRAAGNCIGQGTYSDPYIIEDLIIDGGGSGNCIKIENSDVYFNIENCTVYNSGAIYPDAGILLSGVNNSRLINNNCSFNNFFGIFLYGNENNNNSISGNTANNNSGRGIHIGSYSDNNNITGNTANNNGQSGISIGPHSDNYNITGNTANNNNESGIIIGVYSDNYNIIGNTANNNQYGINLLGCNNNNISGNTVNTNQYGIYLRLSDSNSITDCIASGNTNFGIYFTGCGDNIVSGSIMNECGLGLSYTFEEVRSHHIDTTNLVNGKPLYYYTNEINLEPDDFMNAGQVILVNCADSLVSNLNISYNSRAISLHYCDNISISGNTANNNSQNGIYLYQSDYNTISGNTANYNTYGVYLRDSNYNTVSGNTLIGNDECIFEKNCQGNEFSDNGDCKYGERDGEQPIPGYNVLFLLGILSVAAILIIKKVKKS